MHQGNNIVLREHERFLLTEGLKKSGELRVGGFCPAPRQGKVPHKDMGDAIEHKPSEDVKTAGLPQELQAQGLALRARCLHGFVRVRPPVRQGMTLVPVSRKCPDIRRLELVMPLENDVEALVIVEPRTEVLTASRSRVEDALLTQRVEKLRHTGGNGHNTAHTRLQVSRTFTKTLLTYGTENGVFLPMRVLQ